MSGFTETITWFNMDERGVMMGSSDSQQQKFALRIERGRTQHPERPISGERFLIGAGSNCHLQLGGEMPILHSVIIQTNEGLWIDSVVQKPQLLVNRQPVRDCQIFPGDLIEIADFVFIVQASKIEMQEVDIEDPEEENIDLRELSSEDLIDLLAEEMGILDSIEQAQIEGANALMEKARSFTNAESDQDEFIKRRDELDHRESILAEKAANLERAQERLETYLKKLTDNLKSDENSDGDKPARKTA